MRDVFTLAQALHNATMSEMQALGVTLPSTNYVAPGGTVAYDGEQITTQVNRVFAGNPGAEDQFELGSFLYMSVELQVTIVRYTPDLDGQGNPPKPEAIQASAKVAHGDVTQLSQAFINIKTKGTLNSPGVPVTVGPIMTQGPEGGVVATYGLMTVPLL